MKRMIGLLLGAALFSITATAQSSAPPVDAVGAAVLYDPSDSDAYDFGAGLEAQGRIWLNPKVGFAVSIGAGSWRINDRELSVREDGIVARGKIDGDVSLLPLGGSLLVRPVNGPRMGLVLEAGLRYVAVESDAEIEVAANDGRGNSIYIKDTVEMDDGIIGVIGVEAQVSAGERVSLFAGLSYQFDLSKGDVEWVDNDGGSNELKALGVKAGVAIRL